MQRSTKAALTIASVVGGFFLLCGGGGAAVFYALREKGINLGGLSSNTVAIVMHDGATLSKRHYVDRAMKMRIRLPEGNGEIRHDMMGIPKARRGFLALGPGWNLGVVEVEAEARHFDMFVRGVRIGLTQNDSHFTIEEEGRSTIAGMEAYVFTLSGQANGQAFRQRQVYVKGTGNTIYLLMATCQQGDWGREVDVLDSSFATFELGEFAEDAVEARPSMADRLLGNGRAGSAGTMGAGGGGPGR